MTTGFFAVVTGKRWTGGRTNPIIEALTIIGGDSDFDVAQIAMQTGDNNTRAAYDAMKAKALRRGTSPG